MHQHFSAGWQARSAVVASICTYISILCFKPGENLVFMHYVTNTLANTGCVIKDEQRRYAADIIEYIFQFLTDTFSIFSAEQSAEAVVTVRKVDN